MLREVPRTCARVAVPEKVGLSGVCRPRNLDNPQRKYRDVVLRCGRLTSRLNCVRTKCAGSASGIRSPVRTIRRYSTNRTAGLNVVAVSGNKRDPWPHRDDRERIVRHELSPACKTGRPISWRSRHRRRSGSTVTIRRPPRPRSWPQCAECTRSALCERQADSEAFANPSGGSSLRRNGRWCTRPPRCRAVSVTGHSLALSPSADGDAAARSWIARR